jgi:hypothetical protein
MFFSYKPGTSEIWRAGCISSLTMLYLCQICKLNAIEWEWTRVKMQCDPNFRILTGNMIIDQSILIDLLVEW